MTLPLQRLSRRPELLVDAWAFRLFDPVSRSYVGRDGPRGRQRAASVLPMRNGPPQRILPDRVMVDAWGCQLADPAGNLIGQPAVIAHRMLNAKWTEETRR